MIRRLADLSMKHYVILGYLIVWLVLIPVAWFWWDTWHIATKFLFVIFEVFFAPDISTLREIFLGKKKTD